MKLFDFLGQLALLGRVKRLFSSERPSRRQPGRPSARGNMYPPADADDLWRRYNDLQAQIDDIDCPPDPDLYPDELEDYDDPGINDGYYDDYREDGYDDYGGEEYDNYR